MTAEDWTALGTVTLSFLTLLTLIVSIVLAKANFNGLTKVQEQVEQNQKLISIEEKRDMQAYKVSGWLEISEDEGDFYPSGVVLGYREMNASSGKIFNGSNQPIYQVAGSLLNLSEIYQGGNFRETQTFNLGTVPPGSTVSIPLDFNYRQEILANYHEIFGANNDDDFSNWMMNPIEINFKFRDSEEVWWERTINCRLVRLEDHDET